jgi:hypothetical protein
LIALEEPGLPRENYRRQLSTDKNTGQEERFARFLRLTSLVVAGGMPAWKLLAFQ